MTDKFISVANDKQPWFLSWFCDRSRNIPGTWCVWSLLLFLLESRISKRWCGITKVVWYMLLTHVCWGKYHLKWDMLNPPMSKTYDTWILNINWALCVTFQKHKGSIFHAIDISNISCKTTTPMGNFPKAQASYREVSKMLLFLSIEYYCHYKYNWKMIRLKISIQLNYAVVIYLGNKSTLKSTKEIL